MNPEYFVLLAPTICLLFFMATQVRMNKLLVKLINLKTENANTVPETKELIEGQKIHPDVESLVGVLQEFSRQYKEELRDLSKKIDLLASVNKNQKISERPKQIKSEEAKQRSAQGLKDYWVKRRQQEKEAAGAVTIKVK